MTIVTHLNRTLLPLVLLLVVFTTPAWAFSITINPGAYTGGWELQNVGRFTGQQTFELTQGPYNIFVAGGSPGLFQFNVDASGNVTSQNTAAATGSGNTLTFKTTLIDIQTGIFTGSWCLSGIGPRVTGSETRIVVPALSYTLFVTCSTTGAVQFSVDAFGDVTSQNTAAVTGSGNTLTFETTLIDIQTGIFTGSWCLSGIGPRVTGSETRIVVPALSYTLFVTCATTGAVQFSVDAFGDVTSQNTAAMTGSGNTLTFETTLVDIQTGIFTGSWCLSGIGPRVTGSETRIVVPALSYTLFVTCASAVPFSVDAAGNVTSQNAVAATGFGTVLTLNNTTIFIDPTTYTGTWTLSGISTTQETGSKDFILVPGVTYTLFVGNIGEQFSVTDPCAVDPPQLQGTFTISCGALDSDEDGVPDDTDNCPSIANPGQVDQDLDGLGNVCDLDLDGDDVPNPGDNCPNIANTDQDDLDGDGVGDACDTDTDGDSVPDSADNCLLVPNTDQANSDGDLFGDACDFDDDNDGIDDLVDNCPLTSNPGQADFDSNGQGDVCDGDVDGDGVANGADFCPLSPLGQPVNANGCTGAQFTALQCVRENFVQHGQYVSCVAHATNDAVSQGLMAPKEKARFVKEAAKSK